MQTASCVTVKYEPKMFDSRAATLVILDLWTTIQQVCELIIRLWVGSRISLHYIESPLWVYYTPERNRNIYCDLNENDSEKYSGIYANID